MPPERFGGGLPETALHPAVFAAMAIAAVLVLVLPRKLVVLPVLSIMFLLPGGQAVVLSGVHFFVARIIIIFGLLRVLQAKMGSTDRLFARGYTSIDSACIWYIVWQVVAVILLYHDMPSLTNQFGILLDWIGAYIILRFLIRDDHDTYRALKCFAVISATLAVCMVVEQVHSFNVFSLVGGERVTPEIREGKIRAQAAFAHPLLAGVFGATLMPLFILLWQAGKAKVMGAMGIAGTIVIALASNSSTPLLALAGGTLGTFLWPIRKKMRTVRWGIVITLLVLAAVMKAPVWFIIAHIDLTGGSSSYHRAELIDQFINHFGDWWLIGVKDTASWGWDMWDTQNQYVNVGETGGLVALVWFIAMISRCFGRLGDARKAIAGDRRQEAYAWLLGAALFAHVVGFFGVNYFDQTRVAWLFLLAVISVKTIPTIPVSTVAEPRPMDFVTGATPPVGALEKHGHEALMFARFEGY